MQSPSLCLSTNEPLAPWASEIQAEATEPEACCFAELLLGLACTPSTPLLHPSLPENTAVSITRTLPISAREDAVILSPTQDGLNPVLQPGVADLARHRVSAVIHPEQSINDLVQRNNSYGNLAIADSSGPVRSLVRPVSLELSPGHHISQPANAGKSSLPDALVTSIPMTSPMTSDSSHAGTVVMDTDKVVTNSGALVETGLKPILLTHENSSHLTYSSDDLAQPVTALHGQSNLLITPNSLLPESFLPVIKPEIKQETLHLNQALVTTTGPDQQSTISLKKLQVFSVHEAAPGRSSLALVPMRFQPITDNNGTKLLQNTTPHRISHEGLQNTYTHHSTTAPLFEKNNLTQSPSSSEEILPPPSSRETDLASFTPEAVIVPSRLPLNTPVGEVPHTVMTENLPDQPPPIRELQVVINPAEVGEVTLKVRQDEPDTVAAAVMIHGQHDLLSAPVVEAQVRTALAREGVQVSDFQFTQQNQGDQKQHHSKSDMHHTHLEVKPLPQLQSSANKAGRRRLTTAVDIYV